MMRMLFASYFMDYMRKYPFVLITGSLLGYSLSSGLWQESTGVKYGNLEIIPGFGGVRVPRSTVFCVVFCRSLFALFRLTIVLSTIFLIHGFWLPLWCLKTFLEIIKSKKMRRCGGTFGNIVIIVFIQLFLQCILLRVLFCLIIFHDTLPNIRIHSSLPETLILYNLVEMLIFHNCIYKKVYVIVHLFIVVHVIHFQPNMKVIASM